MAETTRGLGSVGFEPDGAEVVSAGEVDVSVEGGGKAFRYAVRPSSPECKHGA
jgi:hypothetical protein